MYDMSRTDQLRQAKNHLDAAKSRKAVAKRDVKTWRDKIAELEAQPTLAEPPTGATFIKFEKQFVRYGIIYQYGAIRVRDIWYLTGAHSPQGLSWDALTAFIEKDNVNTPEYRYFIGDYTEVRPS